MKRIGSIRRKTRHKLQKPLRQKGKISLTNYFQKLKTGEDVALKAEPAVHRGFYHPRFHGKICKVIEPMGKCYKVEFSDHGKKKAIVVHPVHLKKVS